MATRLALIVFLFYSFSGSAQSSASLDTLVTFQGFSFGSAPNDVKGSLKLDLTISYGLKYYKFSSNRHKEIYGLKVHDMSLGFRNDELEYIDIYYNRLEDEDLENLIVQLENEFGESKTVDAIEKGVIESYRWSGKDTTIDLYRYGNDVISAEDKNKTILAISRPIK